MAEIGVRSGKVRAGFYRVGPFCIHKGNNGWGIYDGPKVVDTTKTLSVAYSRAKRMANERDIAAATGGSQ